MPENYYVNNGGGCGGNILTYNEQTPIVLFPLSVTCINFNPSTTTSNDGAINLVVQGGTPPYTIKWNNGTMGPLIDNLSVGPYNVVVTDYYGDFTAYTTCTLTVLPTG